MNIFLCLFVFLAAILLCSMFVDLQNSNPSVPVGEFTGLAQPLGMANGHFESEEL